MRRAGAHARERVGDPDTRSRCDSGCRPRVELGDHGGGGGLDRVGERRAVGVAQRHVGGARAGGRLHAAQRVLAVVAPSRRRSARRRRRRSCPRRRGRRPTRRSCAGSRRGRRARPSRGAGSRSCRPACRPARTTSASTAQRRVLRGREPRRRVIPNAAHVGAQPGVSSRANSSASFGFEAGKPASIIGTPRSSRRCATRSFSSTDSDIPSPCIPSRRVHVVDEDARSRGRRGRPAPRRASRRSAPSGRAARPRTRSGPRA